MQRQRTNLYLYLDRFVSVVSKLYYVSKIVYFKAMNLLIMMYRLDEMCLIEHYKFQVEGINSIKILFCD